MIRSIAALFLACALTAPAAPDEPAPRGGHVPWSTDAARVLAAAKTHAETAHAFKPVLLYFTLDT